MSYTIRSLATREEFEACADLQRATWGEGFTECVPAAVLQIVEKVGGVVAGAFAPDGTLAGFVLGFTGWRDGRACHWSHMLAVREDARDGGVGRALKAFQRGRVAALGIATIEWSFDPLVARNAHVNLTRLGARVTRYVREMYAHDDQNEADAIIGSDRFVVEWPVTPGEAPTPPPPASVTLIGAERRADGSVWPVRHPPVAGAAGTVALPADIQRLKRDHPEAARAWREATRTAFQAHLADGGRIAGFVADPDGGGVYVLSPPPTPG